MLSFVVRTQKSVLIMEICNFQRGNFYFYALLLSGNYDTFLVFNFENEHIFLKSDTA